MECPYLDGAFGRDGGRGRGPGEPLGIGLGVGNLGGGRDGKFGSKPPIKP